MNPGKPMPLVVHGWTIFAHPLFLAQIEVLIQQVEAHKQKDPVGFVKKNASKRLAAITKLAFDIILQDPARPGIAKGHPWRRLQALVPGEILSAVSSVLSLPHT